MPTSSPRRAQLAQASKVASSRSNRLLEEGSGMPKWARFLFVPPFLLNAPPSICFGNSFSVTLRNLTNFVTILIFLPQGYESLRNIYTYSFLAFEEVTETHGLRKNTSFRLPPHHEISRITLACFLLISDTSQDFIFCATKDAK